MNGRTMWTRAGRAAPLLTGIVLCLLVFDGGIAANQLPGHEQYMADVRNSIDSVPHRIGARVGSDVEPTSSAVRILVPNRILQRRYIDPLSGEGLSLLIVHCGDARDMLGHYPPVCYPAHGWISGSRYSIPIEIAGHKAVAMVYAFSRTDELVERRMTVINFFVAPGDGVKFASDMSDVERMAGIKGETRLGVGQFQLVLEGTPGADELETTVREFVPVLEPVVRTIGRGVER